MLGRTQKEEDPYQRQGRAISARIWGGGFHWQCRIEAKGLSSLQPWAAKWANFSWSKLTKNETKWTFRVYGKRTRFWPIQHFIFVVQVKSKVHDCHRFVFSVPCHQVPSSLLRHFFSFLLVVPTPITFLVPVQMIKELSHTLVIHRKCDNTKWMSTTAFKQKLKRRTKPACYPLSAALQSLQYLHPSPLLCNTQWSRKAWKCHQYFKPTGEEKRWGTMGVYIRRVKLKMLLCKHTHPFLSNFLNGFKSANGSSC